MREHQADKLYDVMTDMVFRTSNIDRTLFEALLDARATHGGKHLIVEDIQRNPASYDRLVMGSFILGRKMAGLTPGEKNVAVLLPNAIGCLLTIFGLHAFGRVPAMLNFSTGAVNMAAACTAAQASTIVTSRRFIEAGGMEETSSCLSEGRKIIYLEDLREGLSLADKLYGLWAKIFSADGAAGRGGAVTRSRRARHHPLHLGLRRRAQGRACCRTATSTPTATRPRPASPSPPRTSSSTRCPCSMPSA